MDNRLLKKKAVHAFGWSAVKSGVEQLSGFLIFLFLGRMLTPEDFGVVALAAAVVEVLRLISWVGLYEAIIRAQQLDEIAADTAFWTSVSIGVGLALGLLLTAAPIAHLFGQPTLAAVIKAMSAIVVVSALGITHTGRLARDFGHKALAMRALVSNLVGGVAAVSVVLAGGGMWALVVQRLAAELMQTVAVWIALPWMPRWRFSMVEVRRMMAFGAGMTVVNIVNGINMRVQEALVGVTLPTAAVGSLRIANRLTDLIQQMVFMPVHQAGLVTFSRLQGDPEALRRSCLRALRLAGLAAFPCFFGLAAVAPDLIPWLFGQRWAASVPLLQALCMAVVPQTLQFFLIPMLIAVNRATELAIFSVAHLALGVAFTIAAAPHGVVWVTVGLTVRSWLLLPVILIMLRRGAGIRPADILVTLTPPFVAALLTAAATWQIGQSLGDAVFRPALVGLQILAFAAVYAVFVYVSARRFLAETMGSLWPKAG